MEKIRYKLQMYELLEESLKYNMTKHQTSSVPPANPPNIETSETRESPQTQCQTESCGAKRIKSELFESRENFVSNLRQENINKNGSGEAAGASTSLITNEPTKNLGNLRTVKAEVQDCCLKQMPKVDRNIRQLRLGGEMYRATNAQNSRPRFWSSCRNTYTRHEG
ncbi:hypothetical protein Ddc_15783 [Ditylenchus destructor]|nr:hypothetical protein Ddc_15783 [Ditylenchus destructor]